MVKGNRRVKGLSWESQIISQFCLWSGLLSTTKLLDSPLVSTEFALSLVNSLREQDQLLEVRGKSTLTGLLLCARYLFISFNSQASEQSSPGTTRAIKRIISPLSKKLMILGWLWRINSQDSLFLLHGSCRAWRSLASWQRMDNSRVQEDILAWGAIQHSTFCYEDSLSPQPH